MPLHIGLLNNESTENRYHHQKICTNVGFIITNDRHTLFQGLVTTNCTVYPMFYGMPFSTPIFIFIKKVIMKRTLTCILLTLSLNILVAQQFNQVVINQHGNEQLIGKTTRKGLEQPPFSEWFTKNYNDYMVNRDIISQLDDVMSDYSIKVFYGSWCGDSRREVPRFYKVLDALNVSESQLEIVTVDAGKDSYKQAPEGEEQGLNIHRVPTFIFYKDGMEVNRIVEFPVETIERDMQKIVSGSAYQPNYKAVSYLEDMIRSYAFETLQEMESDILSHISEIVNGCYEINTYAFVSLSAKQFDKALYLFQLNSKMFPYKEVVHSSLATAFVRMQQYDKAYQSAYRALTLQPGHQKALDIITLLDGRLKKDQ